MITTSTTSPTRPPAPSRRSLFGAGVALFAGSAVGVASARDALPGELGSDAALIALCDRFVALQKEETALHAVRHTIEDEDRTDPAMNVLFREMDAIMDQIYDLPEVTTLDGARAMASVSLAVAPRNLNGDITCHGDSEWLAWGVAEFLAGSAAT